MTAVPSEWEFDHHDPWLAPRMNEVLAEIRDGCPIVHSTKHGGFWAALTHEAAKEATGDPSTYSNADGVLIPALVREFRQPPIDFDPPEHTAYRKIIQPHFTRHGAARYEPLLRELIRTRLTELIDQGSADLVPTLALYVPPIAIAVILGLPAEDGDRFAAWTDGLVSTSLTGDHAENDRLVKEFTAYLADQLDRPRHEKTLISAISSGRIDGRPLTRQEQIAMIMMVTMAGHGTTVHGIATMIYFMATVDGLRERLLEDPALIPTMIDESLRIEAPVVGIARTVRGGARLAGQALDDGERVLLVLNAANHDPAVFDRPDEFVCPRDRNPHVTFGYGVHRCVGEHLALLEMRIVAEELLALAPRFRLADGYRPGWESGLSARSLTRLPVIFH